MGTMLRRIANITIVVLIVVNVAEVLLFFKTRSGARMYHSSAQFPAPSGYLADQGFLSPEPAPCFLIRLSSDACPYCRLDRGLYMHLVRQARQAGCESIVLAPKAGQVKSGGVSSGTLHLQYVDMKLGRALVPVLTPQTIILDRAGRIVWDREGSMDKRALSDALRAVREVR